MSLRPGFAAAAPLLFLMADTAPAAQTNAPDAPKTAIKLTTVAKGLVNPWALEFLPDGRMLVTEKAGQLRVIETDGKLGTPIKGVPKVMSAGQGGLLDVALANDFAQSGRIFLSYSEPRDNGENGTSVASAKLVLVADGGTLEDVKVIFRQQPGYDGDKHFGSRIVVTPEGNLFVTVGERSDRKTRVEAQNPKNHLGKIIYITPDGAPAASKPAQEGWDPLIWSIGHRNVQGAVLDQATGKLWTLEHGPQGGDELNQPQSGKNYGWPVITYGIEYFGGKIGEGLTEKEGLEQPVYYWKPSIATSSLLLYTGDLFPQWKGNLLVGALKYMHVQRLVMKDGAVAEHEVLGAEDIGERVRDVKQGPDGAVYLVTDDGGNIVRMAPE